MSIKKVMVIGSGQMGSGIAQAFAENGYEVVLNDIKEEFVRKAIEKITKGLEKKEAKGKLAEGEKAAIMNRFTPSVRYEDAQNVDLVVEAATENPDIKFNIFKELDRLTPPEVILATNTSSLSITSLGACTKRPDKVVGLHFFNPVHAMALIEVNKGLQTSEETSAAMKQVSESLGKTAIVVKDSPGFVVNRILIPMINEAIFVLGEGISSAEEIDEAMKLGANHPLGPLALADLVGLDVVAAIMQTLISETGDQKYRPAPLLRQYVNAGMLGRKAGEGFYKY